jgi:tetratricopeptide (TPR) repeat protein
MPRPLDKRLGSCRIRYSPFTAGRKVLFLTDMAKTTSQHSQPAENQRDPARALYLELLEQVTQGAYHAVAKRLSELRKSEVSNSLESVRRLISARISIKKGVSTEDLTWLKGLTAEHSWVGAEAQFVLALGLYHMDQFVEGRKRFDEAKARFEQLGLHDRIALCQFNSLIGRISTDDAPGASEQLAELNLIAQQLIGHSDLGSKRVLALVRRQKAHVYEDVGHLNASLREIIAAIKIFSEIGPSSDFHLALLHAADLCLDLNKERRAQVFLEQVLDPVDSRVEFPLAFIKWRLGGEEPVIGPNTALPTGWREKFTRLLNQQSPTLAPKMVPAYIWDAETSLIYRSDNDESVLPLRRDSIEGKLIRLLSQAKMSKHLLIEALWPEHVSIHHIDNRLHRLVTRVNKKFGGKFIVFDGQFYSLSAPIKIR